MLLGCIADDFTGATDLASMLVRQGMRTVQLIGVPEMPAPDVDAAVVALKSRTCPPGQAVEMSLAALEWLRRAGARQILFKYCSTFDSTDRGNIGPVADALLEALGAPFTVACPALPENRRTIYRGRLFVGDDLLSESPMKDHPLTPMRDANLVRVLGRQTSGKVGLVGYETVVKGPDAIRADFDRLTGQGCRYAILDAVEDRHLRDLGTALADLALVTGGSGIAMGLPDNFRRAGLLSASGAADALPRVDGAAAVLSGSCSAATLGQVAEMAKTRPVFRLEPQALAEDPALAERAVAWAGPLLTEGPVLIAASAPPDQVQAAQTALGKERAGALVEQALAVVARGLVDAGVRRLVVAGGETSGAVVQALGVQALRIGPPIDPGVPWTVSLGERPLALALKSGNFGTPDFFLKAFARL